MSKVKKSTQVKKDKDYRKAVALRYLPHEDDAPKLVAKGSGKIAENIIEAAKEKGIHIEENPELVEILSKLDWYQEIPPQLYTVIAEILAFTYRLNNKLKNFK